MAEPTVAIDPRDSRRMAVAADPYLEPARIQVSVSADAGRTWSAATTVLPPGAAKSYDPQLAFAADGSLLISGGASPDTRHGCQRASEVFLAAMRGREVSYHVLAVATGGGLLDRPTLLAIPGSQRPLVAWTASPGPGADCSLRPVNSTTVVALLTPQLDPGTLTTLPHVAQAPFGSQLAISGEGVIGLIVAARDGADGVAVEVYQSQDGTRWRVSRAGFGRAEPDRLPGLGGAVLSMPSISGLRHGFVAAWTDTTQGIERTRLARGDAGGWQEIPAPPTQDARLLPTVAVAGGDVIVVQAALGAAGLSFFTWRQVGSAWFAIATDLGGIASDRHEVGEALGLAGDRDGSSVTAVPVELAGSSALLVRSQTAPTGAASGVASSVSKAGAGRGPARRTGLPTGIEVLIGVVAGLLLLAGWGRARARRSGRRYR